MTLTNSPLLIPCGGRAFKTRPCACRNATWVANTLVSRRLLISFTRINNIVRWQWRPGRIIPAGGSSTTERMGIWLSGEWYIVRHGETQSNNMDRLQGHLAGKLTEKGRKQSKVLARYLKDIHFDAIISSDLTRAREATVEIARFHSIAPEYTAQCRERCFGVFEGSSRADFFAQERSRDNYHVVRPKNGESLSDVFARAISFFEDVRRRFPGKRVLIVSHGEFVRIAIGVLLNKTVIETVEHARTTRLHNACVNVFQIINQTTGVFSVLDSVTYLPGHLRSRNQSFI